LPEKAGLIERPAFFGFICLTAINQKKGTFLFFR